MKTINSFRSKLFALTLALMASVASFAYDFQVDGLNYTITSSVDPYTVEVTKNISDNGNNYEGYTSITIPKSVLHNGVKYQVTGIGKEAFLYTSVSEFTIPETVKYIAESAFGGSFELTSIEIPNSVTDIGTAAFTSSDKLTSVILGDGVTTIGPLAFMGCRALQTINIPESVTAISALAFYDCPKITDVKLNNGLVEIKDQAFSYTNITSIEIPKSVTILGLNPFSYIPSLTKMSVKKGHPLFNSDPNSNAIIETATNTLVAGCRYSIVPNTITVVGKAAFMGCKGRTELSLPNSVKTINDSAYFGCIDLKSIDIPNSVTTIGSEVFSWCASATSLTIGENVNSIGGRAFWGCEKIKTVTCNAIVVPNLGEDVFPCWFGGNINDATLYVPAESVEAYKTAAQWKEFGQILPIEQTPEDLFPTLWGLQQTICSGYYGEEGDEWASGLTGPSQEITMMDGKPYLQWGSWYLREENDKILVYSEIQKKDLVLYDFTFELGDTLTTLNLVTPEFLEYEGIVGIVDCPLSDYDYTYPIDTLVVTELSKETLLDGKEYTRWKFSDGTVYVEGIGSMGETFFHHIADHLPVPVSYLGSYLVCVSKNNKLLYQMDEAEMERLGAECLCEAETPEDLFPTLWGLQRTSCDEWFDGCEENKSYLFAPKEITEINGKQYLKCGGVFLREEDSKVLIYSFPYEKDLVLYDYTLEVGDTLQNLGIDIYSFPELEYAAVVDYIAYEDYDVETDEFIIKKEPLGSKRVTEVSTITLLDGKEYKRWLFGNDWENGNYYVEGIGNVGGSFGGDYINIANPYALPTCYMGEHLVCVSKNNKLLYQMDPVKMDELGAECLCDYDRGPRKDNAKDGQIGGRPTPTQWNQLELDLREMENGTTILRAETFSYTLEDISQQVNNKTYFQLARQSTKDTATTKSVVGSLHFGKDEDNRVYFLRDGVEYILYDFTAEIGDTVEIFAGINNYPQETTYTHVVVDKDTTEDGACRMFLEVVFPDETNATAENAEKVWLAGLGSVDGIVHNAAKRTSNAHAAPARSANSETQTSVMLCAWREDSCLYTTDHPDYNDIGCIYNQDPTAIEDTHSSSPMTDYQKLLRNGQLLIIHKGKTYNVLGVQVK